MSYSRSPLVIAPLKKFAMTVKEETHSLCLLTTKVV